MPPESSWCSHESLLAFLGSSKFEKYSRQPASFPVPFTLTDEKRSVPGFPFFTGEKRSPASCVLAITERNYGCAKCTITSSTSPDLVESRTTPNGCRCNPFFVSRYE